ncbi:MAG: helix-turn-helix domain-containing protein [Methanoregula sp.]|jgi:hypothetical protein|nr:helix-turn-helix domain-containing protein [Methanoregula sp.]
MKPHPHNEHSVASDIQRIHTLILRLENLVQRIELHQKNSLKITEEILKDCNNLISEVKIEFHQTLRDADQFDFERLPDIPIEDPKLKKVWLVLYRYHNGATADTIAKDLKRHRTTVSTYLNQLASPKYKLARRDRIGHEILFKAILKKDKEVE